MGFPTFSNESFDQKYTNNSNNISKFHLLVNEDQSEETVGEYTVADMSYCNMRDVHMLENTVL